MVGFNSGSKKTRSAVNISPLASMVGMNKNPQHKWFFNLWASRAQKSLLNSSIPTNRVSIACSRTNSASGSSSCGPIGPLCIALYTRLFIGRRLFCESQGDSCSEESPAGVTSTQTTITCHETNWVSSMGREEASGNIAGGCPLAAPGGGGGSTPLPHTVT